MYVDFYQHLEVKLFILDSNVDEKASKKNVCSELKFDSYKY